MNARRLAGALLLVLLSAPFLAGFAAGSSADTEESATSTFSQNVNIPRDNVLAALALGCCSDIDDIANIDRSFTGSHRLSRNVDIDDDDVFSLLALDGSDSDLLRLLALDNAFGGTRFRSFDNDFDDFDDLDDLDDFDDDLFLDGFGRVHRFGDLDDLDDDFDIVDISGNRLAARTLSQRVDFDRDDIFNLLALGGDGDDLFDIADISRTRTETVSSDRDFDLDEDDVFLRLALD